MGRDILELLKDDSTVAALLPGREWPSGVLSRTPVPDGWLALIETSDGRRRIVTAGEPPRPEDNDRLSLIRDLPLTIAIELGACRCASGDEVNARCDLVLRWRAETHELAALRDLLLRDRVLTLDELCKAVQAEGARQSFLDFVRANSAEDLVKVDQRSALQEHLKEGLKRFCFQSGARIEQVSGVRFESADLANRERMESHRARELERIEARNAIEEAAARATRRRLDDLREVMTKLDQAAGGEADARWHDLLPALSPTERGRLLSNLWRITPDATRTRCVAVVAGQDCLLIDPADPHRPLRETSLASDLGGLRSVAFDPTSGQLLIGAAEGVWSLDADKLSEPTAYPVPEVEPQRTGFNAVTVSGDFLYATHSKLGCWRWRLGEPSEALQVLDPPDNVRTVRCATATGDGRLVFSTDSTVHLFDPGNEHLDTVDDVRDTIHALAVEDGQLYVGTGSGGVHSGFLEAGGSLSVLARMHDSIESIGVRRWNDLVELVVPAGHEGVHSVYGGEDVTVALLRTDVSIRRAWASDDVVVGLSDRRDRLVISQASDEGRKAVEVPLSRMTGSSIQDACLIVEKGAREPGSAGAS